MQIRQSDLASFAYCAQQVKLKSLAKRDGWHEPILSATARGTVLHFAFQVLQKLHHEGREDALDVALATFEHYWEPQHIGEIGEISEGQGPVDEWIGHDTWGGLLQRSLGNLRAAYTWLQHDKSILLGLEHSFNVPITIDGEEHTLHGTLDGLRLRMISSRPAIGIDDLKGYRRQKTHLDWETQWTLYSLASLHPDFWAAFFADPTVADGLGEVVARLEPRGLALYPSVSNPDLKVLPRRGRLLWAWDGFQVQDVGWRTEEHYARLRVHLREYIHAVERDVYPLTVNGHVCAYCPFGKGICGDAPLPARQEGIQ